MSKKKPNIEDQLRDAVLGAGISRYRISRLSGVSEGVISRFVRGERDIGIRTAAKLAGALKLKLVKDDGKE